MIRKSMPRTRSGVENDFPTRSCLTKYLEPQSTRFNPNGAREAGTHHAALIKKHDGDWLFGRLWHFCYSR
jgi:hypothetical protein